MWSAEARSAAIATICRPSSSRASISSSTSSRVHRCGRAAGQAALLGDERAAAVTGLDEAVADQDADRLSCRAEADVVARRDVAVPGQLVAGLQDARLDLRAKLSGDQGRQGDALSTARERQ